MRDGAVCRGRSDFKKPQLQKNNRLSVHVHDVRFFVGYANTRPTSGELAKRHPESGSLVQFDVSSGCTSTAAVAIIEAIGLRLCMACCAIIVQRN